MSAKSDTSGGLFAAVLNSPYLITVSIVLFFIMVSAAFFMVYQNVAAMRERICADYNQQQLLLARQAVRQINDEFARIEPEYRSLQRRYAKLNDPKAFADCADEAATRMAPAGLLSLGVVDSPGGRVFHANKEWRRISHVEKGLSFLRRTCSSDLFAFKDFEWMVNDSGHQAYTGIICMPLNPDDSVQAFVYTEFNLTEIIERAVHSITYEYAGEAWVIDREGVFLYHPDRELVGKQAFGLNLRSRPFVFMQQATEPLREQMLTGIEGAGLFESARHDAPVGRISRLVAFTPLAGPVFPAENSWTLAVSTHADQVANAVQDVYTSHFAAEVLLIASLFVFGWLAFLYQQKVSRKLQKRVSEQQEIIASIMKNSIDGIVFIDLQNRVKLWNRGAELIFGYRAEEMIGQTFHCLIPSDIDPDQELRRITEEVTRYGYIRNFRTHRITKDNRRIMVDISRTLVLSDENRVLGSVAIIKDITEEVEMDQRIYNAEKLASIGTLAAGVAHEINNPLGIILGFTDLLLERFKPGSPEYEDLRMIEQNAQNAKQIVDDMLGFARVTEGFEDTVDISRGIATVVKIIKSTLTNDRINVMVNLPEQLPRVCGDDREYQQVLFNLINNAVAAMEPVGGTLTITAREHDHAVSVDISDTGIGIPLEIQSQIFDPFFTTKKVGEGTGLGLSLCYGIVKKYGGNITFSTMAAADKPGQPSGSTFTVTMPVCSADDSNEGESE
ncbi:MAG: PAS domain S-box protein [candidate division Zixibacteria bacterium]|nr:PAS domain S-box protein [candidate division Zixibacteria bacterium]